MRYRAPGAGDLKQRADWQQQVNTADGQGGFTRVWVTVGTLWAEILPLGGKEAQFSGALQPTETFDITVRYKPALKAGDRLVWRGTKLNIRSVGDPDGRRAWQVLTAESGVAAD